MVSSVSAQDQANKLFSSRLEAHILQILRRLDRLDAIEKKLDKLCKKVPDDEFATRVSYKGGENLLEINITKPNKYVTALTAQLFSIDELKHGLIRADNSKSTRRELDPERVKVIYGMKIN
jgi:hypothetical protein